MTDLPDEDDDGYMLRLAASLFRRLAETGDPDDLMPALFAARHVLDWHVGGEADAPRREAFAETLPAWETIDAVCDGRRPIWYEDGEAFVEHAGAEQRLVPLCLAFLGDYARLHLSGEDKAESEPPRRDRDPNAPRRSERRPMRS